MRNRLLGAVAALLGCAAVSAAQTSPLSLPVPVAPPIQVPAVPAAPHGMIPVPAAPVMLPPASLPAPPAAPPVMASNPGCGTPAVVTTAAAPCNTCSKPAKRAGGGLLSRFMIGEGTATPLGCGCLAAERTFMFGSCKQFFTPGRTCSGTAIEYGPGGLGHTDNCKNVGSFINR